MKIGTAPRQLFNLAQATLPLGAATPESQKQLIGKRLALYREFQIPWCATGCIVPNWAARVNCATFATDFLRCADSLNYLN
jgi:hypothetical protein